MTTVAISTKFQIVIPREIREKMDITSGMKIEVIPYENRIELVPLRPIKTLKGSLKGIDTTITREQDRI